MEANSPSTEEQFRLLCFKMIRAKVEFAELPRPTKADKAHALARVTALAEVGADIIRFRGLMTPFGFEVILTEAMRVHGSWPHINRLPWYEGVISTMAELMRANA